MVFFQLDARRSPSTISGYIPNAFSSSDTSPSSEDVGITGVSLAPRSSLVESLFVPYRSFACQKAPQPRRFSFGEVLNLINSLSRPYRMKQIPSLPITKTGEY